MASVSIFLLWLCLTNNSEARYASQVLSIASYAALGDSYAAGAGAGSPLSVCGRFTDAYPIQIASDIGLDIRGSPFRHLACGGSTSTSVLYSQVPDIGNADLVTITVAGNEVDFSQVLNECIYHWHPFSTCEAAITESRRLLESSVLWNNFDALVAGTVERMKPHSLLLVTGYARFFNEKTDLCDHVTFSRTRPLDYLTKSKRSSLNALVEMLNEVIRATAQVHGALYVDIDTAFAGHRFCEDGVHEPDLERTDTWFLNLPPSDFGGGGRGQLLQGPERTPERHRAHVDGSGLPTLEDWVTFHPTTLGHRGITEEIMGLLRKMGRVVE
ncbi:hypothetical protein ABEF91_004835 [Exophiala dermatitidis]